MLPHLPRRGIRRDDLPIRVLAHHLRRVLRDPREGRHGGLHRAAAGCEGGVPHLSAARARFGARGGVVRH